MRPTFAIREPRADEASALTDLAMRAKASWGYADDFLEACRAELTITPATLDAWRFWVAEKNRGGIVGMIALGDAADHAEVEDFFVAPEAQGEGVGRALMDAFQAECRARGLSRIEVDADPNAEAIYARLGFRTVGRSRSGSIPGRFLPRMVRTVAPPPP
jgi:GNAT superfamily N-acetyltransferase